MNNIKLNQDEIILCNNKVIGYKKNNKYFLNYCPTINELNSIKTKSRYKLKQNLFNRLFSTYKLYTYEFKEFIIFYQDYLKYNNNEQ